MPKIIIDDAKGLYQTAGKGVVGLTQSKTVNASLASGVISSGAIVIPANSLITAFHTVVTTTLAGGNTPSVTVGTTAGGNELALSKQIANTAANAAATKGQSTNTELNTALAAAAGNQQLVIVPGQAYRASETNVHFTITAAADLTAGAAQFTVEFITFE